MEKLMNGKYYWIINYKLKDNSLIMTQLLLQLVFQNNIECLCQHLKMEYAIYITKIMEI